MADGTATLYYTGSKFPTTIPLQDLHYFMPYLGEKGIRDVYEIVSMRTISSREARQDEGSDAKDDLRLAFELKYSRSLSKEYKKLEPRRMIDYSFLDTTFSELDDLLE